MCLFSPLLVGTVILVFLSIFTKSQESSPFEAMNSAHLSMCQKDVRPSVQKRWNEVIGKTELYVVYTYSDLD